MSIESLSPTDLTRLEKLIEHAESAGLLVQITARQARAMLTMATAPPPGPPEGYEQELDDLRQRVAGAEVENERLEKQLAEARAK